MSMLRTPILVALAVVGCSHDTPAMRSTAESDALWILAPAGARGGIVLSPQAVAMFESGSVALRAFIAKAPELAAAKDKIDFALTQLGGPNALLADMGLSRDKGFAMFFVKDGMVAVLPVGNRDVFLAKVKGTKGATPSDVDRIDTASCKLVNELYACATSDAILATVGKGELKSRLERVNARGEIELVGIELPLGGPAAGTVAAVAQLERGAATVRGIVLNAPHDLTSKLAVKARPRTTIGQSSGFGVIDLRPMLADVPPEPLVEGVTFADITKTNAGPITISVPAGQLTLDIQVPLSDPAPFTKVVEHCTDLPPLAGAATVEAGVCHVKIPDANLELDAWVEGKQLRIGKKGPAVAATSVPMSPAGIEMANGEWAFAFWGRGSMFGPSIQQTHGEPDANPAVTMPIRIMSAVNEAGIAVKLDGDALRFVATLRTSFANPDDVLAKLVEITSGDLLADRATDKARPIALAHPGSPFAADFKAGQGGLLVPTTLIGMGATVAIPAVLRFMRGDATGPGPADAMDPGGPVHLEDGPTPRP